MYAIRTKRGEMRGERCKVRTFKHSDDMHKFLNTSDNALHWRELGKPTDPPAKRGTYIYAGGRWHNVKNLDPCELAHL